ncbi:MAG: S-adenosylmethionine synthase [Phycisphaerae bacterium]|nr:S-adenosylmethionine synthase [Phycisphaerae bacterium]
MSTNHNRAKHLFTSESVAMGHPDKVADQISDAILDAMLAQDPASRVACETLVTTGMAVVAGEITTKAYVHIPKIVRETIQEIGYTDAAMGFDYQTCAVITTIDEQSPDIAQGVLGKGKHKGQQGAGDQGLMFGFACRETGTLMPLPIHLSHRIVEQLARVRMDGTMKWLRPDGKSQVTIEYHNGQPYRIHTVVLSAQHDESVCEKGGRGNLTRKAEQQLIEKVILPVLPKALLKSKPIYHINPTGRFVVGGPQGDCGLTGRKIIVDTYGGRGCHGGGAFSGKDPSKVDRSASYMARYLAKNVVAAGLAEVCEVQIAYAIGVAEPVSLLVDTQGTGRVDEDRLEKTLRDLIDLTPAGIIKQLQLRRPVYKETARHGHFGRTGAGFTWEKTDLAPKLNTATKKWIN